MENKIVFFDLNQLPLIGSIYRITFLPPKIEEKQAQASTIITYLKDKGFKDESSLANISRTDFCLTVSPKRQVQKFSYIGWCLNSTARCQKCSAGCTKRPIYSYNPNFQKEELQEEISMVKIDFRRFEYIDSKSNKFWEIWKGTSPTGVWTFTTQWGRIGNKGQRKTRSYGSTWLRNADYNKLISSKLKKGYTEVTSDVGSSPSKPILVVKEKVTEKQPEKIDPPAKKKDIFPDRISERLDGIFDE